MKLYILTCIETYGMYLQKALCVINLKHVFNILGDWGAWSRCTTSCGNGERIRRIECPPRVLCGNDKERETCNLRPCPGSKYKNFIRTDTMYRHYYKIQCTSHSPTSKYDNHEGLAFPDSYLVL